MITVKYQLFGEVADIFIFIKSINWLTILTLLRRGDIDELTDITSGLY